MKNLVVLSFLIILFSCNEKLDSKLLLGEWELSSWTKLKTQEPISGNMSFTFKSEKRYEVDYGTEKEIGKYWLMGKYLHTLEDGQSEKKVLITTLTLDSLAFEMNRAGSMEEVVLLKK